jgi:carbon storage regulator CsrA
MLVLTRKLQQQIKIGEQITVTILKLKGNTVRVGIQAPREMRVIRGELPKENGALDPVTESAGSEGVQVVIDTATEPVGAPMLAAAESSGETAEASASLTAAHLPLRRIRSRYGAAPLKQVIASCATLAK